MRNKTRSKHDKQIETWSKALKVALEFVDKHAAKGDEEAKKTQFSVLAILYENETEEM